MLVFLSFQLRNNFFSLAGKIQMPELRIRGAGFETGCHYVAQASHELVVLWPQPPDCWVKSTTPNLECYLIGLM